MDMTLTCRITHLLFKTAPHINFATLVSGVQTWLAAPGCAAPTLSWDCDDMAFLDFDAGRVVVAFSDTLPGAYAACLTIAAGMQPVSGSVADAQNQQDLLCQSIADMLDARFQSDAVQTQVMNHALTPDLIDQMVDRLFQSQTAENPAGTAALPAPHPATIAAPEAEDMDHLLRRLSSELVSRAPNLITKAITDATLRMTQNSRPPQSAMPIPKIGRGAGKPWISHRLFWKIQKPQGHSGAQDGGMRPCSGPGGSARASGELKAVRDALYAADPTRTGFSGRVVQKRLAAGTLTALQTLAALPAGFAAAVSDLRRSQNGQIRH